MSINYLELAEGYRPEVIKMLLVCEAPPPSQKTYFYLPRAMSVKRKIEQDMSLPATIFNHYFEKRPTTESEYEKLLLRLKRRGIFLIDICDKPIRVRDCPEGVERIRGEIGKLRRKMMARGIDVPDEKIIFLLPRMHYRKQLREEFPCSTYIPWIDFRMKRG